MAAGCHTHTKTHTHTQTRTHIQGCASHTHSRRCRLHVHTRVPTHPRTPFTLLWFTEKMKRTPLICPLLHTGAHTHTHTHTRTHTHTLCFRWRAYASSCSSSTHTRTHSHTHTRTHTHTHAHTHTVSDGASTPDRAPARGERHAAGGAAEPRERVARKRAAGEAPWWI